MSTSTARADALVAATVPYALTGLGNHILDHELPSPLDVEVPGRGGAFITIWLRPDETDPWLTAGITIDGQTHESIGGRTRHQAYGILDGSCLRVRLIWHTPDEITVRPTLTAVPVMVCDHIACQDPDCDRTLCYCLAPQPCEGTVNAGCDHFAEFFCENHRDHCTECQVAAAEDLTRFGGAL